MRTHSLRRAMCFFLMLMMSCFAWSRSQAVTLFAMDYPPYSIVSESDHQVSGMDADIIRAAFAAVNVEVQYQAQSWETILSGLQQGQMLGTLACAQRPERLPYMFYSDEISTSSHVLISRRELNTSQLHTFADMARFDTLSVANWAPQKLLEQLHVPHQVVATLDEALLQIEQGKADILYVTEYPALTHAKMLGLLGHIKATPLANQPLNTQHLCVSRQYPNARMVINQFNAGLRKIKRDGTFAAIRNRYF